MNIEDLKNLGVDQEAAEQVLAMCEKALADKESELEMASEKIGEMSEENRKLADKVKELSEEITALQSENDKLVSGRQSDNEDSQTVDMGLKHGAAASGEQFGFKFTGIWCK